jgi:hypothetical protein
MSSWIASALYPDTEPPEMLEALADPVDFLSWLCAAWDFGVLPYPETVAEIRRPQWREAVDACRFLTSPAYYLLANLPQAPNLREVDQAFSDLNEALGYAVDGGYRLYEADIRVALAWAHLAVRDPAAARAEAERAQTSSTRDDATLVRVRRSVGACPRRRRRPRGATLQSSREGNA